MKIQRPQAVILDVGGTTTSWDYFRTTLRPFLESHTRSYLTRNFYKPVVQDIVNKLRKEQDKTGSETRIPPDKASLEEIVHAINKVVQTQLESRGDKSRTVVSLCHLVWTHGFESGDLKGHVYNDVPAALRNWRRNSVKIFTISVLSLEMQELTFVRSQFGNLNQFIEGYFSTEDYGKSRECFKKICKRIKVSPTEVVYVTNRWKDADAAKKTGIKTILIDRTSSVQNREKVKSLREITWP